MFFNKKSAKNTRRQRQPAAPGSSGAKPVFSYHARSARTDLGGARSARYLWTNQEKPAAAAPRPSSKRLPRRLIKVALIVIGLALLINSLILSRDPKVIVLSDAAGSQELLRSEEEYTQAARRIIGGSFANTTKMTVDTKEIAQAMLKQFPELEHVSVTLPLFGHQPTVVIEPARLALLLKTTGGTIFVLNASGRAVMTSNQVSKLEKLGLAVVVDDQSGLAVDLGETALPSDDVAFITEVLGQLRARQLKVSSMVLPLGTSELHIRVVGTSYTVKFNLRGDARVEVGAYLAVKQHLAREGKKPRSYIDVRVDNRAYYR